MRTRTQVNDKLIRSKSIKRICDFDVFTNAARLCINEINENALYSFPLDDISHQIKLIEKLKRNFTNIHPALDNYKRHSLIIPLPLPPLCLLGILACTCNEGFVSQRSTDGDERLRATTRDKSRSYAGQRRFITGCRYVNERQLSSKLLPTRSVALSPELERDRVLMRLDWNSNEPSPINR